MTASSSTPMPAPREAAMHRRLRLAALLSLLSLALMCWAVIDPRALPLVMAMTLGQAIGTLALVIYLVVIVGDLIASGVFSRRRTRPEPAIFAEHTEERT
jgi:hypothetical protein